MNTQTRKVLAVIAVVMTTGIAAVGLTRSAAQAEMAASSAAGYATARVEEAFKVVAEMPAVDAVMIPMAAKGDLEIPLSCVGPFRPEIQSECMDVAYEVESGPYVVVEARTENTSILTRMLGYTMAIFEDGNQQTR